MLRYVCCLSPWIKSQLFPFSLYCASPDFIGSTSFPFPLGCTRVIQTQKVYNLGPDIFKSHVIGEKQDVFVKHKCTHTWQIPLIVMSTLTFLKSKSNAKVTTSIHFHHYRGNITKIDNKPWKDLVTRYTLMKYQSTSSYHLKDTAKVKIFNKKVKHHNQVTRSNLLVPTVRSCLNNSC
jgi:hypothetical protein